MSPRAEFVLLSTALALLLALSAYVLLAHDGNVAQWGAGAVRGLVFGVPAAVSAALAAWLSLRWQRRAHARQRRWTAVGLNWRILLLAYLLFPLMMSVWITVTAVFDQSFAPAPGNLADNLLWLPAASLLFTAFAIVLGAIPAFVVEYFLCRRYLRRTAVTTGSA